LSFVQLRIARNPGGTSEMLTWPCCPDSGCLCGPQQLSCVWLDDHKLLSFI